MNRCHFCGKILHEIPFECHRCGNIFCSAHHLPENHHCSRHHQHDHKPHHTYCGHCGHLLTGLPYKCNRCGVIFCDHCRLPENHGCKVSFPDPSPFTPPKKTPKRNYNWKKIKEEVTLKNFTIVSALLIAIGLFFVTVYPQSAFQIIFTVGLVCFALAYYIYAVKCWEAHRQISAVFMITIPLLVYFFSTTKIPEAITNIAIYLFIQFCFYAIISVILLFLSNKVKIGIERYILHRKRYDYRYFLPNTTYSIIGIGVFSLLLINYGSISLFSDNAATITNSLQHINAPSHTSTNANTQVPLTTVQNPQIIPTLAPVIVKNIQDSVSPPPPTIDQQTLERRVHELINQQRRANGLSSLSFDSSLASIARKHSADMAQNNYFSHYNLQGLDPTGRGARDGYSCYKNYGSYYTTGIAENIMQNNLYDWSTQEEIAQSTVSGWMGSSGHRKNILTSTYDREGIGVAIASDDKVYITEDFC